jgi:hypothetical protein
MQGTLYGWLFTGFGLLVALGYGVLAWRGLDDFEAAYGYQPPSDVEMVEAPAPEVPLLERTIATPQTPGVVTVAELLALLHTAASGNVLHYVGYLDRLGARESAARELRRIVLESDDPPRVLIAESTLRGWGYDYATRPLPPPVPLRERTVTIPDTGETLSVDAMLQGIHTDPVERVRWYLSLLDAVGARQLAINELRLVLVEEERTERAAMARSRLASWGAL